MDGRLVCAACGSNVEIRPFIHDGTLYEAPLYFSKPNQSKEDFASENGRTDFCSANCAFTYMTSLDG